MTDDARPSARGNAAPRDRVDVRTPNVARMYDYYLGGKDNFAADREAAKKALEAVPEGRATIRENRAFLGRAVRFLAGEAGIRQFLDIGTGLPTQDNTHEVAQKVRPDSRIVYVDNDAVVLSYARALLAKDSQTIVVEGDMRRPEEILADPGLRGHIDLDRPVAVLLVSMLHFVPDEAEPAQIVATIREAIAPGSYLAISHMTALVEEKATQVTNVYEQATSSATVRSREQIQRLLTGFDLVDPGLVALQDWRPDAPPSEESKAGSWFYAAVGRKP
ncbi:MAG: SAM-dependent methyltransferase [Streptosporangiaceae bacterium]